MYKKLRILFTCLSALAVAAAFPVAFSFGLVGLGSCALAAILFFILMLLCKQAQEQNEPSDDEQDEPQKK